MKFACPSCGFRIFNRRYEKCERCGNALPQPMLLSRTDIQRLDAEAESSRRAQAARATPVDSLTGGSLVGGLDDDGVGVPDTLLDLAEGSI